MSVNKKYFEKELGSKKAMKATIRYCRSHDILKEFLESHAKEVLGMNIHEWNMEDALAVAEEEGIEKGLERGREEKSEQVARNLLDEGMPIEAVARLADLPIEKVRILKSIAQK
jgi:predicted transposase/invertase (TIGR01784 family)